MMSSISKWVAAHFDAHRKRTRCQFLWRISLEGILIPLVLAAGLDVIFQLSPRTDLASLNPLMLFVQAVIVAPFIETLLLQALPVMIARRFGMAFWGCVVVSLFVFAAVHLPSGLSTFIFAGLVSGFYITFTYVHWRGTSFRSALWMTSGSHAIHNLVIVLLAMFAPE